MIGRDRIVGVDAFFVANVKLKVSNVLARVEGMRSSASYVFDKARILVSLHRYMTLVGAFE